jgi:hypothetical protein
VQQIYSPYCFRQRETKKDTTFRTRKKVSNFHNNILTDLSPWPHNSTRKIKHQWAQFGSVCVAFRLGRVARGRSKSMEVWPYLQQTAAFSIFQLHSAHAWQYGIISFASNVVQYLICCDSALPISCINCKIY